MTTLLLTQLWLNRMDTGEAIHGASGRTPSSSYGIEGSVRTYASGRRRAISTEGLKVEIPRTMVALDYATKEKLITWLGVHCQLRDYRGGRWFGVFFDLDVSEYMRPDLYAATITLLGTTTTEGV
jgi:hypothetical protein